MGLIDKSRLNPNPITKIIVVGILGVTILHSINSLCEWAIVFLISIMFLINGLKKDAIKNIIFFGIISFIPNFNKMEHFPLIIKMFLSLFLVIRMFYIPYIAGKFLIKTSDVGSIISSMDVLKIPSVISIPVAVMFRFFPSFIEEKNNIKLAMKIRGINTKNPFKYIEYIAVPLLIISSKITDDISRSAETKCIANPIKKTRYISIKISIIDLFYLISIIVILIGGYLCLK